MRNFIYCLAAVLFFQIVFGAKAAAQSVAQNCPTITVTCPDSLNSKKPSSVNASVSGIDAKLKLVYRWTVLGGEIIEGQGTQSIKIKSSGNALTAVVIVEGLDATCNSRASCSIIIDSAPSGRLFDKYGSLRFKDERARLSTFAKELRNELGSQGYVIVYVRRDDTSARANRARDYLSNEEGIDARRIVIVEGGIRKERAVELYIVPTGATPPKPGPNVSNFQD